MSVVLYEHPFSPYAVKCKILLHEKGVAFEARLPEAIGSGSSGGAFLAANPRGEVPALIDDGFAIFDSSVICEYIEDKWAEPAFRPGSPMERAKARMIEEIMDTQYEAINWAMSELVAFKRAEGEEAAALKARAQGQYDNLFAWLTRELGGRDWFGGDRFGWADMAVIPFLNGTARFRMGPAKDTDLRRWMERCNARESLKRCNDDVQRAIATPAQSMDAAADRVKAGAFKREYRDHRLEWMLRSGGARIVWEGMEKGNIRFSNEIG
ncbi:MAG: glutathione S-transferase family protein [Alphaproteobacteria bacterium]|nr:glutathione S-transferase family protein [Alphaproteobacteria bacterium]